MLGSLEKGPQLLQLTQGQGVEKPAKDERPQYAHKIHRFLFSHFSPPSGPRLFPYAKNMCRLADVLAFIRRHHLEADPRLEGCRA
jgi:hypothetical protein